MSTTLASTTSSAMFYSEEEEEKEEMEEMEEVNKAEEVEEMKEPIGTNITDLEVRKETDAFLEDNKQRRANIRF